ncbi:MAG: hypothetical protein HQK60_07655 [Deltaproteobacteria bacterium]|nr:hypothetical protein [Deltaproteobacteria bacterium]
MTEAERLFKDVCKRVDEYKSKFIKQFIPTNPKVGPDEYELEVKAFCLLSHAALEEFFEKIALTVMSHSIESWKKGKLSDTAIMLVGRYSLKYDIPEGDEINEIRVYDHVRSMLEETKRRFSRDVHMNHGASPRYLRALLVPVGIDFMPDVKSLNSLIQLSQQRGRYAHKGFVRSSISPEDALACVEDCLAFAMEIRNRANQKLEV